MPKSGLSMHAVHLALQGCMHADVQLSSPVAQVRAAGLHCPSSPQGHYAQPASIAAIPDARGSDVKSGLHYNLTSR